MENEERTEERQEPGSCKRDAVALALLLAIASALLLTGLESPYLWQDEAQTALIAETILDAGVPHGSDGRNFFSQERGAEYADGHVWRWHTWLSFYAVAASFTVLGPTTVAARLPFALFGIATVLLAYATGRRLFADRVAAFAGAGLLSLSVPWLILCRQARWYGAAGFFVLLGVFAYARVGPGERRHTLLLFFAATLLFHTHYLYCATLLATLLAHALWLERQRLLRVGAVSLAVFVVNLPWIVWLAQVPYTYGADVLGPGARLRLGVRLATDLAAYFAHPLWLLVPLGLVAWRRWRRAPPIALERAAWRNLALLALLCVVNLVVLALLAPGAYFRYLGPIAAVATLGIGLGVGALARRSRVLAGVVVALFIGFGSIGDFAYEITHDFDGPIEGIVRFLDTRARPSDTVAISQGDMPIKFYTELRVVGGLTGEDLSEAAGADWIILRRNAFTPFERELRERLREHVVPGEYVEYRIRFPDTAYENREDPRFHRFRSAPDSHPRVVIFGRKREGNSSAEPVAGLEGRAAE